MPTRELGERVARLEAGHFHHYAWTGTIAAQAQAHDERIRKIGSRVGQTVDRLTVAEKEIAATKAELAEMEKAGARRRRDLVQWAATVLVPLMLIAAGALGYVPRETVDQVLPQLKGLAK